MREVMGHLHHKFEQYNVDLQDRNKIYANVVFRLMLASSLRYDPKNISTPHQHSIWANIYSELEKVLPSVSYIFEIMSLWERPVHSTIPADEFTNAAETLSLQFHTEITNFFMKMPYVCIVRLGRVQPFIVKKNELVYLHFFCSNTQSKSIPCLFWMFIPLAKL